jgi:hypothetical protein
MQTDINAVKLYRRGLQSAGFDVLDGYFIRKAVAAPPAALLDCTTRSTFTDLVAFRRWQ